MISEDKKIIVVCGPTASGKTEFAHRLALKRGGEIVNADSMQIYQQIPIITASPEQALTKELPYHLYNFRSVDQEFSAIKYADEASEIIKDIHNRGKQALVVGGTGMYIDMLINGYNQMPDVAEDIRQFARDRHQKIGAREFFLELQSMDPQIVSILNQGDTQRVIRAYEVVKYTGHSILFFHNQAKIKPLDGFQFEIYFLCPKRQFLYSICNKRFESLWHNGGLEEVQILHQNYPNLQTTAMKAVGVREMIAYLKGEVTKQESIEQACMQTRRYAKRQLTWFNNQLQAHYIIEFADKENYGNNLNKLVN